MSTCFVDSTTLLYPLDARDPTKQLQAQAWLSRLLRTGSLVLSPQVLNEIYWVVRRKPEFASLRPGIRAHLDNHMAWATAPLDTAVTLDGWAIEDRYRVRFWDTLLLASANAAGCGYFLSEDLNDGQLYGAVRAINPFRHTPADVLERDSPKWTPL